MRDGSVSLSNIYNYFKNKDKIFCTVLEPLLSVFDEMKREYNSEAYLTLDIFESDEYQKIIK